MRALPWFLLLLAAVATPALASPADVENNLVFRRQNGETITFPGSSFALCGPYFEPDAPAPSLHVITYDGTPGGRYWRLGAILSDVVIGEPRTFPNVWTWPNPDSVSIYVGDTPNQTATFTPEASGWIVFQQLDCTEGGFVEFTIDARLGSMLNGFPWVEVQGSFKAPMTSSPFVPAQPSTWGKVKAIYR